MTARQPVGLAGLLLLAATGTALAHAVGGAGHGAGFTEGFLHPWSGLDSVAAMIAVGMWGAQLGTPAIWLLPVTFPVVMAVGGVLGIGGARLLFLQAGIGVSVLALGVAVLAALRPPVWAAGLVVAAFAVLHGYGHGADLPPGADGLMFSLGFVIATGMLHAAGIALGLLHGQLAGRLLLRGAGAAVAVVGSLFLWSALA